MNTFDEDLLFHRALTGSAVDDDWTALEALAARDPAVWERLARSLREDRALARAARPSR